MTIYGPADKVLDFVGGVEAMTERSFIKKYAPLNPDDPDFYDYDLAIEKWGTKWGDCNLSMPSSDKLTGHTPDEHGNICISMNFDTAWGPAAEGMITVSERWPTLVFGLTFNEQGMDFMGSVIFLNGKLNVLRDDNIPMFIHPYSVKVDHFESDPWEKQHELLMEWLYWEYREVRHLSVVKWQEVFATKSEGVTSDT
jgi:hypothetical protein